MAWLEFGRNGMCHYYGFLGSNRTDEELRIHLFIQHGRYCGPTDAESTTIPSVRRVQEIQDCETISDDGSQHSEWYNRTAAWVAECNLFHQSSSQKGANFSNLSYVMSIDGPSSSNKIVRSSNTAVADNQISMSSGNVATIDVISVSDESFDSTVISISSDSIDDRKHEIFVESPDSPDPEKNNDERDNAQDRE